MPFSLNPSSSAAVVPVLDYCSVKFNVVNASCYFCFGNLAKTEEKQAAVFIIFCIY